MNLYKVSRKGKASYDEFRSFVCVAPNEQVAARVTPNPFYIRQPEIANISRTDKDGKFIDPHDGWVDSVNDLTVELIGTALPKYKHTCIIDFNNVGS